MNQLLFFLLRFTGLPFIIREFIQKNKVTILMLHKTDEKTSAKIFQYLSRRYNIIDLNYFITAAEKKLAIQKKSIILTFDDGHILNYEMLPILKKTKIPVTVFLCSSIINTNRHFWFTIKGYATKINDLKRATNAQRIEILEAAGFSQEMEFKEPQALQKWQLMEMKEYVNFQSHTKFHPILPKCTKKEANNEISDSKKQLEKEYDLMINAIAYPNGDYSDRDIQLAKEAGYKCGITVDFGYNTIYSDMFRLKRISINDTNDLNELIVKASGLWAFIKTRNGRKQSYGYSSSVEK